MNRREWLQTLELCPGCQAPLLLADRICCPKCQQAGYPIGEDYPTRTTNHNFTYRLRPDGTWERL